MNKAKQKGSKYERDIAKMYVDYGIDKKATRMPLSGADVYLKSDIRHAHDQAIPFRFIDECKRQEKISVDKWWRQVKSACTEFEEPVLHFKKSHFDSLTVIKTETFMTLLKTIMDLSYGEQREEKRQEWDNRQAENKLRMIKDLSNQVIKLIK